MTQPRLSTVYDFSNLRLHPNGLRVYQKETNLRPDLAKITVQGPREAWIARDAGGSGKIPKTRRRVKDPLGEEDEANDESHEEKEELSEIDEKPSETHSGEDEDEGDSGENFSRKRKKKRSKQYAQKRQRFAADFGYLNSATDASSPRAGPSSEVNTEGEATEQTGSDLPDPSPELLKFIHRYAAEFYTERGQLLNITRNDRKKRRRKARRNLLMRRRQVRLHKARANPGSESEWSDTHSDSEEEDSWSDEDSEDDQNQDEDEGEESAVKDDEGINKGKEKVGERSRKGVQYRQDEKLYTDMYKMFDGTAIVALGMLVQEHVAQMLNPEMPAGWKEEMSRAYGDLPVEYLQDEEDEDDVDQGASDEAEEEEEEQVEVGEEEEEEAGEEAEEGSGEEGSEEEDNEVEDNEEKDEEDENHDVRMDENTK